MLGLGLSFLQPSLGSYLSLPCLLVAGASYGLGVGPASFILMSSIFTQKNKSLGVAMSQISRTTFVLAQMKVRMRRNQLIAAAFAAKKMDKTTF